MPTLAMDGSPRTQSPARPALASQFAGVRIHFIGIGGSGMSGLARMLVDCGAIVTGSERSPSPVTMELAKHGVKISRGQMGELLDTNVDLVVRTAAVPDSNVEFQAALRLGLPTIKYAEMLGRVMGERHGIAVAGTHGKSTTTAMIAFALLQCGADPSFVVGGTVPQLGGGSRSGGGSAFVAEACEFDRSFHNLRPRVAVLLNIEEDHLDCYGGISEIVDSFRAFARLLPPAGRLIVNGADPRVAEAICGLTSRVETIALDKPATWSTHVLAMENGCHVGEVSRDGERVGTLRLAVPGRHNLYNATVAVAACATCGVEPKKAIAALADFKGVDRRMTHVGSTPAGAIVIDDYGHHPTEIRATLAALRERYQPARLICVFQPHQHSRTRFLLDDFATAFGSADEVIVPDIYFVRDSEAERHRVSSGDLVGRVNAAGGRAMHLAEFGHIVAQLKRELRAGDLIVTMGAGNVWEIGRELLG